MNVKGEKKIFKPSSLSPLFHWLNLIWTVTLSAQNLIKLHYIVQLLKGHSQLVHMRIRYNFLVDLHMARHHKSRAEKRIL